MADNTAFQLTVYECPEQQRGAVLGILSQYQLSDEWGGSFDYDTLSVGADTHYVSEQTRCGTIGEIATAIIAAAPGATFAGREDPKYEWLGEYHAPNPLDPRQQVETEQPGHAEPDLRLSVSMTLR